MKSRIAWVFLSLLLSSCAGVPEPPRVESVPAWVQRPETLYPSQRYLSAVGSGRDRESAVRDAQKNLAEAFSVKVQSSVRSASESKLSQTTEGSLKGDSSDQVTREVTLESVTRLRGAEIREAATVGNETFVLLALDRLTARSGLLLEANQVRGRLEANLEGLEESFSGKKFGEARQDLEQLRALMSEASVLGMSGLLQMEPLERRFQKLETRMREANRKSSFLIKTLKGDERFARHLETCIQDQGGSIIAGESAPEGASRIQISVIEQPQHLEVQGWTKMKYEVSAQFIDPSGKTLRINESRTETARSKEAALEAAADELSKRICEQTWNRLGELK